MDIRKLFVIVFLLLACSSVEAQYGTYSPRMDSLRRYVTSDANLPYNGTTQVDSVKIIRAIVTAIRNTCVDYPAVEKFDTLLIDSTNNEGGTLPTDFSVMKEVFLMLGDTLRIPLQNVQGDSLFLKRPTMLQNLMELANLFSIRTWHVHGTNLIIHPKWARGDTAKFLIEYYAMDTTTFAAGTTATVIRDKYRRKIIDHAVSQLWAIRGNFARAEFWMNRYRAQIND